MKNYLLLEYVLYLLRKALKTEMIYAVLGGLLWSLLYSLTDFETVCHYFWIGLAVCVLNTIICDLKNRRRNVFMFRSIWVVMAGAVLVLYHAGFEAAAVVTAAAIFASPCFKASVCEGLVGVSLLVQLALLMPK